MVDREQPALNTPNGRRFTRAGASTVPPPLKRRGSTTDIAPPHGNHSVPTREQGCAKIDNLPAPRECDWSAVSPFRAADDADTLFFFPVARARWRSSVSARKRVRALSNAGIRDQDST